METRKANMTDAEKRQMAELVADSLANGGKLLISITHASASNMSYRYKVVLAYMADQNTPGAQTLKIEFLTLNYWMAAELGEKLVCEWAGDTLRGHGCGFDRYHDAAYTVGKLLERHGLITEPLKTIANRNIYREI